MPDGLTGPNGGSTPGPDGADASGAVWRIGDWQVDAATGEFRRGTETLRVEPKVAETMLYLAQRAGQVVSRDELLNAVWPGLVVGDDALTQAIIKLRKALGDDARRPTYIETLAKRGYRLVAPVARIPRTVPVPPAPPAPAAPAEAPVVAMGSAQPADIPLAAAVPQRRRAWRWVALGGGLATVALLIGFALGIQQSLPWPGGGQDAPRAAADAAPVIAVLPLRNQGGDPARDFFSDGITDEIIHALGRYSGLRVISRNSVQQFKQREATPRVISSELGARYVVTGSVREAQGEALGEALGEAQGKVRVAVELSDAMSGRVLWSERFEGEGGGVFEIQDRIVRSIVGALAIRVTSFESERAAARPPSQPEAHDLVLLARSLERRAERAANRQGRALVAQARDLAPDYAMAHVVESELEHQRADLGWMEDPVQGLVLAERAARRALALNDPGANARAHAMLARILSKRGDHQRALAEAERAKALNPSDTFITEILAETLLWMGRGDDAVALLEAALRLDPAGRASPVRYTIVGAYFTAGRYPEALAAVDRGLADHPNLAFLHAIRAAILVQLGRMDEARQSYAAMQRVQPNFPVEAFGHQYADPAIRDRLQGALLRAGP
ncbi:MAG: winged helix-turn-helix domain-containing protein [Acetobacteraceae bacterium]|nr:winged helix-turn-helix domain-containing protein [Acetobacteraceae bacterium]